MFVRTLSVKQIFDKSDYKTIRSMVGKTYTILTNPWENRQGHKRRKGPWTDKQILRRTDRPLGRQTDPRTNR